MAPSGVFVFFFFKNDNTTAKKNVKHNRSQAIFNSKLEAQQH